MDRRRAIVFIDGNNWYHNSKSILEQPSQIDFRKLSDFICDFFNLSLIEIRYYNSIPDISDGKEVYHKHMGFLEGLKKQGIIVRTRKLKKILKKNIVIEKGIDVLISADMIKKTLVDNGCEVCILISGDADFIPVMEIIKDAKKEAITSCVIQGYARELLQGKFRYFILKGDDLVNNCLK
jgi:uncharacterized LabA/DUF88 family protein